MNSARAIADKLERAVVGVSCETSRVALGGLREQLFGPRHTVEVIVAHDADEDIVRVALLAALVMLPATRQTTAAALRYIHARPDGAISVGPDGYVVVRWESDDGIAAVKCSSSLLGLTNDAEGRISDRARQSGWSALEQIDALCNFINSAGLARHLDAYLMDIQREEGSFVEE